MTIILSGLLFLAITGLVIFGILWILQVRRYSRESTEWSDRRTALESQVRTDAGKVANLTQRNAQLAKWSSVVDADAAADRLRSEARAVLEQAQNDARILLENTERQYQERLQAALRVAAEETAASRAKAKAMRDSAQAALTTATNRAASIMAEAEKRAETIAGSAYDAVRNAEHYEQVAKAMKNVIEGYGDQYLVPAESLLDDLAEAFSHKEAGQKLKEARAHTNALIKADGAAQCEYVESGRREKAESFVLDAFNGKVDSILSRVKHDNYGTLLQEIRDAFMIVNNGGKAFRDARITDAYLTARVDELRWASVAQELRRQEQEEQRLLREKLREEQKAQRDIERALRESAKEEDAVRKAMAIAETKIAQATEDQRAKFEQQLAELNQRLKEAEDRGQRALSMAQQTRRGFVYIISNVGSFGEHVYKVGLTRRLEPLDRVRELGDSSVPFEFDVHALILSDDAPALECQLHKHFVMRQVNKVNHRKEFFRAELTEIRKEIESLGIAAHWTMTAEATQYRETLAIERKIESDPAAREAWLNRQLCLEPTDFVAESDEEDEPVGTAVAVEAA